MKIRHLEIAQDIWKDKRIPIETKLIYSYIYSKGFEKLIVDINVGEIQRIVNIKNIGLRKNLEILEKLKYLIYKEYSNGLYTIKIN